jgi:hypothetical protein
LIIFDHFFQSGRKLGIDDTGLKILRVLQMDASFSVNDVTRQISLSLGLALLEADQQTARGSSRHMTLSDSRVPRRRQRH